MRASRIITLLGGVCAAGTLAGLAHATGVPIDGKINFQESVTTSMDQVQHLHKIAFIIITLITIVVMALMAYIMLRFNEKANPIPSKNSHNTMLEVVWTAVPVMIVLFLIAVATRPLYFQDVVQDPDLTIKAVGNQWNWDYVYPDHGGFEFNSSPLTVEEAAEAGKPARLAATAAMVVPVNKKVRVVVTASDVIHAFAVPAFGVKIDAVPGRLNETWFEVRETGTYYGQCSEICGKDHFNMPIEVKVVTQDEFDAWVLTQNPDFAQNNQSIVIEAHNTHIGE